MYIFKILRTFLEEIRTVQNITVYRCYQPCSGTVLYRKEFPSEAEISQNYCATNSGSPEVELRFYPWLILFKF